MLAFLQDFIYILLQTVRDVLPILTLIVFFQLVVLRQPIPNLKKMIVGGVYVIVGLAFFLLGLEKALFPIGEIMATQLSNPAFVGNVGASEISWTSYYWIFIFWHEQVSFLIPYYMIQMCFPSIHLCWSIKSRFYGINNTLLLIF